MNKLILLSLLMVVGMNSALAKNSVRDTWLQGACAGSKTKALDQVCSVANKVNANLDADNFLKTVNLSGPSEGGQLSVYYRRRDALVNKVTASFLGALDKNEYGFYYLGGNWILATSRQQRFNQPRHLAKATMKSEERSLYLINQNQVISKYNDKGKKVDLPAEEKQRLQAIHSRVKTTIRGLKAPKFK